MMTMTLDLDFVRQQFPAFSEPSLKGQAFFENAGGSYMCQQVIDRFNTIFYERKLQPYYAFKASTDLGKEMDQAHQRMARYLNVPTDEVMFGPSTSQNTYVLAQALLARMSPGDGIIVSGQEHEANAGVWRRLEAHGMKVLVWEADPTTGRLDLNRLADLLGPRITMVAMTHCSNLVAEINPVRTVADMVHDANAILLVDGVSYCPHGLPDIDALGADIYLFSSYKTYGPHQGIMIVRHGLADRLANQAHFFNAGARTKRFTPAGPDHAQVAAAAGMADYVDALYEHHIGGDAGPAERARIVTAMQRSHEDRRLAPLLDFLGSRNDARILGSGALGGETGRVPTVALHTARPA
ncbi:MAG: aminotransferase class V-fold PLP-dependent enzyme, partial [Pseudomonadota bacterium]|nr:aminotransferase class V-fold PLP-dependent enzyme [Pseudomonadota bacterium]